MNCGPASLNARTACARCLPRGSLPAITTWLLCQMVNKSNCEPLATQLTQDWSDRVVTNSGNPAMRPSANTFNAVHTFLCTLIQNNLHTKMLSFCCFAPDNMMAAVTPVLTTAGFDPWQDWLFGDYSGGIIQPNGVYSNAFSFGLDTGVVPDVSLSLIDAGMTMQVTENFDFGDLMGVNDNPVASRTISMSSHTNVIPVNRVYADCWTNPSTPGGTTGFLPEPAPIGGTGFWSLSRRAANDFSYYRGFGGVFTTLANVNTTAGTRPGLSIYVYGFNDPVSPSAGDATISFAAVHRGLTAAETQILYNAVNAMRVAMGGGDI